MSEHDTDTKVEYRGTGFWLTLVLALVAILLLIVMAIQNTASVPFEFLGWDFELPLFGLLLFAALVAVVIDELVGLVLRRRKRQLLAEREELGRLRKEIARKGTTDAGAKAADTAVDSSAASATSITPDDPDEDLQEA